MPYNPERTRLALLEAGVADPEIDCHERAARIASVVQAEGITQTTCYRQLRRIRRGEPARLPRSDRGSVRAWPQEALAFLQDLVWARPHQGVPFYQAVLKAEFPDVDFRSTTVRSHVVPLAEERDREPRKPLPVWRPDRLRFLQNVAGLASKHIADTIGMSVREWELVLSGEYLPPVTRLPALAAMFGTPIDALFVGEEAA